jgi:hypothetical protein
MADRNIERGPERGLSASDDLHQHQDILKRARQEAETIINRYNQGGEERAKLLGELRGSERLSEILTSLRQLRESEFEPNGLLRRLDEEDGSYDRRIGHRKLNHMINWIRGLDIDLNRMWGTRWARKVGSWFGETIPNWWTVEWRAFKDNAKHFLTTTAVVGAAGAGLTVGGYALAHGGLTPGLQAMGRHIGGLFGSTPPVR